MFNIQSTWNQRHPRWESISTKSKVHDTYVKLTKTLLKCLMKMKFTKLFANLKKNLKYLNALIELSLVKVQNLNKRCLGKYNRKTVLKYWEIWIFLNHCLLNFLTNKVGWSRVRWCRFNKSKWCHLKTKKWWIKLWMKSSLTIQNLNKSPTKLSHTVLHFNNKCQLGDWNIKIPSLKKGSSVSSNFSSWLHLIMRKAIEWNERSAKKMSIHPNFYWKNWC